MENKTIIRQTRWFFSARKEKMWLEEMAQKGWFFRNITWGGVHYTFEKGEPKKMVYEIDRFDLPKSPRLSEIKAKKEFFDLAEEMGWKEVTHDVDMNYYFAKEWEEDGINELYDTEEMRKVRADKYYHHYMDQSHSLNIIGLIVGIIWIFNALLDRSGVGFFGIGYLMFVVAYNMMMRYFGDLWRRELSMSAQEWEDQYHAGQTSKVTKRFFLSSKSLEKYLMKMSSQGWHVKRITSYRYYFEKGEAQERYYVIDSKKSVNFRLPKGQEKYEDGKDIMMQNNDWQYRSVEDAEALGWRYLCASSNLLVLYTRKDAPWENEQLATKRFCLHPWVAFYLGCFAVGFVLGFLFGFLL